MFDKDLSLAKYDPELFAAIQKEEVRQEEHIELIASENYTSPAVMEAQGTKLTNKYAEGYPHKRYYGGCEYVDITEDLAIERVKQLYGAEFANVQPHSGSQANSAVYQALCVPGDTVLGMSLAEGGHLTHGAKPNFSGKMYNAIQYGLKADGSGELDYDQVEALALEHKPKMIVAGFSAYSRVVDWARFREIADKVGAYLMVDMAHVAGLIAAGVYPNPMPFADVVTSTTHKTLRGPRGGIILSNNEDVAKKINSAVFPGGQGGPLCHVIAAKAVAFKEALSDDFKVYQQQVVTNARVMAKVFLERGIDIVSGGTDNHLLLVSLLGKEYTGKDAEEALGAAFITVNKNAVPNDTRSPFITSGLRVGTPAITTRGFKEAETEQMTNWICDVLASLENGTSEQVIPEVKAKVLNLCADFPVYGK
ncbi:serine hydroxymethyltransferase [Porticoccaceae bacterium LTM1]|nr:serine hydroxymethyltransferase [Porticoccaceae bacterium LTM1]